MSSSVDNLIKQGQSMADKAGSQAQSLGKQGFDAASDMADQAGDMMADLSSSIISYTKKNPAAALGIAAAAGVVLFALFKALAPTRD
jgi:ElaB/YqjD/DUF883 family membrane-anchored ribosome-binding protein